MKTTAGIFSSTRTTDSILRSASSSYRVVIACVCALYFLNPASEAQLTIGIKAGYTPQVRPGTAQRIINRSDRSSEILFNSHLRRYTPAFGLMVRLDNKPFWFSAELLGQGWTETYTMKYLTDTPLKPASLLQEKNYVVEMPVSVGVSLGKIEIFSGLSVAQTISHNTDLAELDSYSSKLPKRTAGWHSGIGINLHNVMLDVRYAQSFDNYGQHRYINGEELTLGNAPRRVLTTITYRF